MNKIATIDPVPKAPEAPAPAYPLEEGWYWFKGPLLTDGWRLVHVELFYSNKLAAFTAASKQILFAWRRDGSDKPPAGLKWVKVEPPKE